MVEKLNQRPHEKCRDQRTNTRQQARQCSNRDTEQITGNPDEFERKVPFMGNNDWYCIIY